MLDRLVGGTVFSVTHGVVRKHENSGQLHQRRETDRRSRVVAEDEERCAKGPEFGQRETVHYRGHRVLANTEMQVLPTRAFSLEISRTCESQGGLVRWPEVRRHQNRLARRASSPS